jgi:hypothetical protein
MASDKKEGTGTNRSRTPNSKEFLDYISSGWQESSNKAITKSPAADFAKADIIDLFGQNKIDQAKKLSVDCFENSIFINDGKMNFTASSLPYQLQLSTFKAAATIQTYKNSARATVLMGNFYANNVELGRQDADFGSILISNGDDTFSFSSLKGVAISGEVRKIERISIGKRFAYILARNNNSLQVIAFK